MTISFTSTRHRLDADLHELITHLQSQLVRKAGPDDVAGTLQKIRNYAAGQLSSAASMNIDGGEDDVDMGSGVALGDPERIARDVLVQCLMKHGSRSFSHFLNVTERCVNWTSREVSL